MVKKTEVIRFHKRLRPRHYILKARDYQAQQEHICCKCPVLIYPGDMYTYLVIAGRKETGKRYFETSRHHWDCPGYDDGVYSRQFEHEERDQHEAIQAAA